MGHFGDTQNPQTGLFTRRLSAVVDYQHSLLCSVYSTDPVLSALDSSDTAPLAAAERFAQRHFVQWGARTQLVKEYRKDSGMHLYCWQNILPSGAMTGGGCSIIVDSRRSGIVCFVQQKAIKSIAESAIDISADEAEQVAVTEVLAGLPTGLKATATDRQLILSYHAAPDYGPVWQVGVRVTPRDDDSLVTMRLVTVDAMTGKVLTIPH